MSFLIRNIVRKHSHSSRTIAPTDAFYDVVINGAGLNGIATAVTLANSPAFKNRRILMVDKAPEQQSHMPGAPSAPHQQTAKKSSWNSRVVAFNPSSVDLVDSWGRNVWDKIVNNGVGRILQMKLSDASSNAYFSFGDGHETMAWIVETSNLLSVFNECLEDVKSSGQVTVLHGNSVCDVKSDQTGDLLNLVVDPKPENPVWTKLLLVADGAQSSLREQLYFRKFSHDYNQLGVVATLKFSAPDKLTNGTVAYQRFLPTGPIAMLPLDEDHCSLVWSADRAFAQDLLTLSDEEFVETVNDALTSKHLINHPANDFITQFRNCSPRFLNPTSKFDPPEISEVVSKRMTFPLRLMHALPVTQHRVVLIGDAAHTLHPLAGLGLNLGLGDVAALRRVIEAGHHSGEDIGTTEQLANFRNHRNLRSLPLAAATHFLHNLYASQIGPLVALRSFGVTALDLMSPVKSFIVSQASDL